MAGSSGREVLGCSAAHGALVAEVLCMHSYRQAHPHRTTFWFLKPLFRLAGCVIA